MRQSFEPLLYKAGVDLALYGHVHAVCTCSSLDQLTTLDYPPLKLTRTRQSTYRSCSTLRPDV